MSSKTHQKLNTSDHSDQSGNGNNNDTSSVLPLEISRSEEFKKSSLDDIIEQIPVGLFHYRLLFICGLAFMADGLEVSLLSFIAACAGIEWELRDAEIALIASIVFAGQFVGTLFFGPFCDKYGRRMAFLLCCLLISGAGLASGVATNYTFLVVCRALVGFGVGGAVVPFDLLAEFLPNKHRGVFLIYIEGFWTIGSMFVAGVAWWILSSQGWRLLTIITAIPVTVSSIIAIVLLPESPRWLMTQGREKEAKDILHYAASVNKHKLPYFELDVAAVLEEEKAAKEHSVFDFLRADNLPLMFPLWTVWLCFGFTYYGVILLVARVFQTGEGAEYIDQTDEYTAGECTFHYQAIFISAASELLGCIITGIMIDSWGRVSSQASLYAGAAIAVFLMSIRLPIVTLSTVAFCARLTVFGAQASTWTATPELFTTSDRGTGHAVANSMARVGAFFAPFLVEAHNVPVVVVGSILAFANVIATIATLRLPETLGRNLDVE